MGAFSTYMYLHWAWWNSLSSVAPNVLDDPESRAYFSLTHTAEGAD